MPNVALLVGVIVVVVVVIAAIFLLAGKQSGGQSTSIPSGGSTSAPQAGSNQSFGFSTATGLNYLAKSAYAPAGSRGAVSVTLPTTPGSQFICVNAAKAYLNGSQGSGGLSIFGPENMSTVPNVCNSTEGGAILGLEVNNFTNMTSYPPFGYVGNFNSSAYSYTIAHQNSFVFTIVACGEGQCILTLPSGCITSLNPVSGNYSIYLATCINQPLGKYNIVLNYSASGEAIIDTYVYH